VPYKQPFPPFDMVVHKDTADGDNQHPGKDDTAGIQQQGWF